MACNTNLQYLGCGYSGVGYTSQSVGKKDDYIQLMRGHGSNFPDVRPNSHFYITVEGCNSCCEVMRVVRKEQDRLYVERGLGDACSCISSQARVEYNTENPYFFNDINNVVPINVQAPLRWDCTTNTLSIDCSELFKSGCGGGCDCEDENDGVGNNAGGGGLRGEPGKPGKDGATVASATISATGLLTFVMSDGSTVVATGTLPKGGKGDKGDPGKDGKPGVFPLSGAMQGENLVITMSDDSEIVVEGAKGGKGDKGDQGDPGEKGDQGVPGERGVAASYLVKANASWYVYGPSNTSLTLRYDNFNIPVTTGADGVSQVDLSLLPTGSLVRIFSNNTVIGIGVV